MTPSIRQGGDGENRELKGSKANGNRGLGDSGWGWCEDSDCIVEFEGWMDDFIDEK